MRIWKPYRVKDKDNRNNSEFKSQSFIKDQIIVNKLIDTLELQSFIYMTFREFNIGQTFLLSPNINNIEMQSHAFTENGYFNYLIENSISQYSFKFFEHSNRNRYFTVKVNNDSPECLIELHLESEDNKEIKNKFLKHFKIDNLEL
jgi:hypothetical protein